VNGFYQVQGGPRNLLSGDKVTLNYVGDQLTASSWARCASCCRLKTSTPEHTGNAHNCNRSRYDYRNRADVNGATGPLPFPVRRVPFHRRPQQVRCHGSGICAGARRGRHHRHPENLRWPCARQIRLAARSDANATRRDRDSRGR
jgi:hypothetical protein